MNDAGDSCYWLQVGSGRLRNRISGKEEIWGNNLCKEGKRSREGSRGCGKALLLLSCREPGKVWLLLGPTLQGGGLVSAGKTIGISLRKQPEEQWKVRRRDWREWRINAWLPVLGLVTSPLYFLLLNCAFIFLPCASGDRAARWTGSEKYAPTSPRKSVAVCRMNLLNLWAFQPVDCSIKHKRKY